MKYITLSNGMKCKVDDQDFNFFNQWKWKFLKAYGCSGGYAVRNGWDSVNKKFIGILMHRLINKTPSGLQTDHRNGDKLDNTRRNLWTCTQVENMHNRGRQKNNKSGYKGVCWDKNKEKWLAKIRYIGRDHHIGRFDSAKEASIAYGEYRDRLLESSPKQQQKPGRS